MSLAVPSPGFRTWGPAHPRPARPERKRDGQGHQHASGHGRNQIPRRLNLSSCMARLLPDLPEPQFPCGVVGTTWSLWPAGMTITIEPDRALGKPGHMMLTRFHPHCRNKSEAQSVYGEGRPGSETGAPQLQGTGTQH